MNIITTASCTQTNVAILQTIMSGKQPVTIRYEVWHGVKFKHTVKYNDLVLGMNI